MPSPPSPAPNLGAQFEGSDGILVYTARSLHRIYDDSDNATGAIVGGANALLDGANGCVNQRTLALINGRVFGCAKDGIYSTDGHHPLLLESGRLAKFFENQASQSQRSQMCAVAWHGSYLLALTRSGDATNGLVLEVYTALPRMSGDSQHPIMAMDIPVAAWASYPSTIGDVLYFADSSTSPSDNRTYVRRYGQGGWDTDSLDAQLPITADAQTGATTFGIPHPKHVRRIQLAGRGVVTIGVQADFETGVGETQSFELTGTGGGVWGVGVWGTGVWGGAEDTGDATRWYIKRGRYFSLHLTETSVKSGTGRATLGGVSPPIGGASIYSAIVCVTPLASDHRRPILGVIFLPYNIANGNPLDASQVMANLTAILGATNGGLDSDNVISAAPVAQDSVGGLSAGSSSSFALADHKHILRAFEQLPGDPTTGNFVPREYYDTTNNRKRLCIAVDGSGLGTWVTTGNGVAADVPNHASRHASGGADALSSGSVDQTMLSRTVVTGTPTADVGLGSGSWADVVTGVSPVVSGSSQLLTAIIQVGAVNSHASNNPSVAWRLIDQTSTTIWQSKAEKLAVSGNPGASIAHVFCVAWVATTSPTLKLQGFADLVTVTANKTATFGSSTGNATQLQVVVG